MNCRFQVEVSCPRTCEVRPRPESDPVVQPLHLRNRRNLRPSELPVSAWVHHSSIPRLARTPASPTVTHPPFHFLVFFRIFRPRSPGPPLFPWPHPGRTFSPKRTKEDAEGLWLFPTHERGSDGRWSGARSRLNLEKAVETTDDCEVRPRPESDPVVQHLHLRNRRNLRPRELPVSAWVHHSSLPRLARTPASPTVTHPPFHFFVFFRIFRPRSPGPPLFPWPHPGRTFSPKRTKEDAEGLWLFPTHERGSDGRWSGARSRLSLEKAVETTDDCEVRPRPESDPVVQHLHLRNRRNLRPSELPVLGSIPPHTPHRPPESQRNSAHSPRSPSLRGHPGQHAPAPTNRIAVAATANPLRHRVRRQKTVESNSPSPPLPFVLFVVQKLRGPLPTKHTQHTTHVCDPNPNPKLHSASSSNSVTQHSACEISFKSPPDSPWCRNRNRPLETPGSESCIPSSAFPHLLRRVRAEQCRLSNRPRRAHYLP
jgi:hypothetical protein